MGKLGLSKSTTAVNVPNEEYLSNLNAMTGNGYNINNGNIGNNDNNTGNGATNNSCNAVAFDRNDGKSRRKSFHARENLVSTPPLPTLSVNTSPEKKDYHYLR